MKRKSTGLVLSVLVIAAMAFGLRTWIQSPSAERTAPTSAVTTTPTADPTATGTEPTATATSAAPTPPTPTPAESAATATPSEKPTVTPTAEPTQQPATVVQSQARSTSTSYIERKIRSSLDKKSDFGTRVVCPTTVLLAANVKISCLVYNADRIGSGALAMAYVKIVNSTGSFVWKSVSLL